MIAAIEATELGKRYRGRWVLRSNTLSVPTGKVVGLVGANGAGKSTLLHLAVGLLQPSEGAIQVLGERPARSPVQLSKVGFVAQDAPVYRSLTVEDHLTLGHGSIPHGMRVQPRRASPQSVWTAARGLVHSRAGSGPSWPSPSRSESAHTSCCSMNQSQASTPWRDGSSSRT